MKSLADCPVISVQSVRSRTNMALFIIKGELSIIRLGRNGAGGKGYKQSFGILLLCRCIDVHVAHDSENQNGLYS